MLIKEILKYTPPEHPNNGPLLEALRLVKQVRVLKNYAICMLH